MTYQGPIRPGTDEKIFRETGIEYNPNKTREDVARAVGKAGTAAAKAAASTAKYIAKKTYQASKKAGSYAGRKVDAKLNKTVAKLNKTVKSRKIFKKQGRMTVRQRVEKIKSPSSFKSIYMKDNFEEEKRSLFFS